VDAPLISLTVTSILIVVTALAARVYFHRIRIERPPIGVFNLRDVGFSFVVLVVVPPLYLRLPRGLIATVLTVFGLGLLYFMLSPMIRRPAAFALATLLAVGEVVLDVTGRAQTSAFIGLNDLVLIMMVVGVCNTWAQSGIRGRDTAVFAAVVAGYDLVATGLLPTTADFATRLASLPFAPTMGWGTGSAAAFTGLGDLLFIVLWPLVAEKAYSAAAGRFALGITLGCVATITTLFQAHVLSRPVPGMVLMGPAIIGHWLWLRHRHPVERTAGEYESLRHPDITPLPEPPVRPDADLVAAIARIGSGDGTRYHAVHEGTVLASGTDAGAVLREASARRPGAVPVLVLGSE
jgi:hypothetical protein